MRQQISDGSVVNIKPDGWLNRDAAVKWGISIGSFYEIIYYEKISVKLILLYRSIAAATIITNS